MNRLIITNSADCVMASEPLFEVIKASAVSRSLLFFCLVFEIFTTISRPSLMMTSFYIPAAHEIIFLKVYF